MEGPYNRKRYSREFKLEAVRRSHEISKTVAEVARELDVRENDLHEWRSQVDKKGDKVFPGTGRKQPNDDLSRLSLENKRLVEENALLKKAAIYFAKESEPNTGS